MNYILIDKCKINEVEETKLLGVIIDNTLKWSSHLKYISGKIAKGIRVIIKARKVISPATLLSLYNSLIMPHLTYDIHVWGNAYDTHLSHLMSLQNKVVRIIAGVSPRTHAEPLYADLNIMPLKSCTSTQLAQLAQLACSCINSVIICFPNFLLICLPVWTLYMIVIQDSLSKSVCIYHYM